VCLGDEGGKGVRRASSNPCLLRGCRGGGAGGVSRLEYD